MDIALHRTGCAQVRPGPERDGKGAILTLTDPFGNRLRLTGPDAPGRPDGGGATGGAAAPPRPAGLVNPFGRKPKSLPPHAS